MVPTHCHVRPTSELGSAGVATVGRLSALTASTKAAATHTRPSGIPGASTTYQARSWLMPISVPLSPSGAAPTLGKLVPGPVRRKMPSGALTVPVGSLVSGAGRSTVGSSPKCIVPLSASRSMNRSPSWKK